MPPLSRHSGRLLRKVGNKTHATEDDHHDPLPTPPLSATRSSESRKELKDEAIYADPESSGDEVQSSKVSWTEPAASLTGALENANGFKVSKSDRTTSTIHSSQRFQPPKFASPDSSTSKRSADEASSGSDDPIFSSQLPSLSQKRQKRQYGAGLSNIHAVPGPRPSSQIKRYGQAAKREQSKASKRPGLHVPKKISEKKDEKESRPKFQAPQGTDLFAFGTTEGGPQQPGDTLDSLKGAGDDDDLSSPSLSPLSSGPPTPEVEEISALNLPAPIPYVVKVDCPICGQSVPKRVKEDFEDEHTGGAQMSFKWQQRFCRHHQKETARESWRQRGYPEIDWYTLDGRFRSHHNYLRGILSGRTTSNFRGKLAKQVERQGRTGVQRRNKKKEAKNGTVVGYYGPKGEKLMTEHILQHMHNELRDWASSNELVAASGLAGGVSGFVQAVLVPELAVRLVCEDLRVDASRATDITTESADLGELLHPEIVEQVTDPAENPQGNYGAI